MTIEQTKLEQARKIALDVYRETSECFAKAGLRRTNVELTTKDN